MTLTQLYQNRYLVWLVRCCKCGAESTRASERAAARAHAVTRGWLVERFLALCPTCRNLPPEAQP